VLLHTAINRLREHGGLACLVPGGAS
jgi:hypothetical protein